MSDNPVPVPVTGFSTSSTIGELTKALSLAHKDFKPVLKDANNPFFKSKYADLAGVIDATGDALSKQELAVIQSPGRIYNGHILLTTLLSHSSGEWIKDELELPIAKFDAQGTGSAITYARRYAYQAIVGVAAEDDDGNAASQKFEKQADGNFAKSTENGQKPKPAGRPKKESVSDAGKPWAGQFEPKTETTPGSPVIGSLPLAEPNVNIHGVDIKDSEIEFPGDPKPEENRLPTDEEAKGFRTRLIAVKDKGYPSLAPWILKKAGKPRTNDIPYAELARIVDEIEAADKAGTLKEMLAK